MLEGKLDGGEGAAFSGGSVAFKLQKGIDLPLDTGQKERLVVVISRSPEHESAIHVPRVDYHDVLPSRTAPAPPRCKRVRVTELSCGFGADRCDTSGTTPFRGPEAKHGGDEACERAPSFPVLGMLARIMIASTKFLDLALRAGRVSFRKSSLALRATQPPISKSSNILAALLSSELAPYDFP